MFWSIFGPSLGSIFHLRESSRSNNEMGTTLSVSPPREKHQYHANGYSQQPADGFRSYNSQPFMAANVNNLAERNLRKPNGFLNALNWKRFSMVTSTSMPSAPMINDPSKKPDDQKYISNEDKENLLFHGQKLSNFNANDRHLACQTSSSDNNNKQRSEFSKNPQVIINPIPNFKTII